MGGGPGRAVTAKHLSGISSEDAVSGKSEEQGRQAQRIRVGNKERVNVLKWKTSRGECGSVSARGPVGDTQHVENHIGGVCISRLIHLGRYRRTAPPRKSPRPLYNVVYVYDNRKGTSWKSGGAGAHGVGAEGELLLDKKLGVPQPKSRESGGFGQNHYQKMEGGQKPFTVNSILQNQFGTRSSLSFLFLFFISVSIITCCTLARF